MIKFHTQDDTDLAYRACEYPRVFSVPYHLASTKPNRSSVLDILIVAHPTILIPY